MLSVKLKQVNVKLPNSKASLWYLQRRLNEGKKKKKRGIQRCIRSKPVSDSSYVRERHYFTAACLVRVSDLSSDLLPFFRNFYVQTFLHTIIKGRSEMGACIPGRGNVLMFKGRVFFFSSRDDNFFFCMSLYYHLIPLTIKHLIRLGGGE